MRRTLRGRIVVAFAGFALLVAVVFGLAAAMFVYTVEDAFFAAELENEGRRLEAGFAADSTWPRPSAAHYAVYASPARMPADLRPLLAEEPWRREFPGASGRHYHVRALAAASPRDSTPPAWLVAEVSDQLVVRPMRRDLALQWLVVEAFILGLALLFALGISRRISRPLTQLSDSLRDLDPSVPGGMPMPAHADREVATVAQALRDLHARVGTLVDRERRFTRDASHELRTPLAVIRSSTAQALEDDRVAPATRELLTMALRSAEQLERTVHSLLALARERPATAIPRALRLRPLLEDVILEQAAGLEGRPVTVQLEVPDAAEFAAHEDELRIIVSNLIGNAFVHAAPGAIVIRWVGGALEVENPRWPEESSPPAGASAGDAGRASTPGYGFGLDIARRLAARNDLGLTVADADSTRFRVVLAPNP